PAQPQTPQLARCGRFQKHIPCMQVQDRAHQYRKPRTTSQERPHSTCDLGLRHGKCSVNVEDFSKKYFEILTGELEGLNLTAIRGFDEFHQKQILDSVLPLDLSPTRAQLLRECGASVDIGFGGGFPLLPLAWRLPEVNFLGFEA